MEREYIVPLRREFQKAPKYRRANRAIKALRDFIARHMKSDNISIGRFLNTELWSRGMRNPPHKVAVKAIKDSDGKVTVELKELPIIREKVNKKLARVEKSEGKKSDDSVKETKKESKTDEKSDKIESKKTDSKKDPKSETKKDKKSEPKKDEKSESKEEESTNPESKKDEKSDNVISKEVTKDSSDKN